MKKKISIILRRDFARAALLPLGINPVGNYYSAGETRKLLEKSFSQSPADKPYPFKYLFGAENQQGCDRNGLLNIYYRFTDNIEMHVADGCIESLPGSNFDNEITYDLQFSDATPQAVLESFAGGNDIVGWTHPALNSKSLQMLTIALGGSFSFLPSSVIIPDGIFSSSKTLTDKMRNFFNCDYLILKSSAGSASRLIPYMEYAVFPREKLGSWIFDIAEIVRKDGKQDMIISELIHTDDPFGVRRCANVVHKINCFADVTGKIVKVMSSDWSKKIVNVINRRNISSDSLNRLGEIITETYWLNADVSHISAIRDMLNSFDSQIVCNAIFTVDFMIPSDGNPRFLEINKLSATFSDMTANDNKHKSAIDIYASSIPVSNEVEGKIRRIGIVRDFYDNMVRKFYSKSGVIFISSEKGAEFVPL